MLVEYVSHYATETLFGFKEGTVNDQTYQKWFTMFPTADFTLNGIQDQVTTLTKNNQHNKDTRNSLVYLNNFKYSL